ncbi:MAG: hypothetical protein GXP51_00130 [Deltaproteobacteria bacterium]|nr:hypothetical protein [Deltaproteobacteria bacterium]
MIISIVSGKGGAGKTTIATSLAHILQADYYDLDVDAPNGEYFLQPENWQTETVFQPQPKIDKSLCNACGACARECRFNALYKLADRVYLNDSLCHSCNLCREVCPQGAISYKPAAIGSVRSGDSSRTGARAIIGDLRIGSTRATALIQRIVRQIDPQKPAVIDGPPGNSCTAVAAIKPAELVILVVEPTPFGIHDMLQTLKILKNLNKPLLIIANKSQDDGPLTAVLAEQGLTPAASIPLKIEHHKSLLAGEILSQSDPKIYRLLQQALTRKTGTE